MRSSRQPLTRSARSIKAIVNKKILIPVTIVEKVIEKPILNILENNPDNKNIQKKKKGKESRKQEMNNDN